MTQLRPLGDGILFQFEDDMVRGAQGKLHFKETTNWGFTVGGQEAYDSSAKLPRWAIVKFVGKKVPDNIAVGSRVLIEPLKWTSGVKVNDETYWKTNSDYIMAIGD